MRNSSRMPSVDSGSQARRHTLHRRLMALPMPGLPCQRRRHERGGQHVWFAGCVQERCRCCEGERGMARYTFAQRCPGCSRHRDGWLGALPLTFSRGLQRLWPGVAVGGRSRVGRRA